MRKLSFIVLNLAIGTALVATSCSKNEAENPADAAPAQEQATIEEVKSDSVFAPTTNIRYIDEVVLFEKYNLAKDIKEAQVRTQSKLVSAQESRAKDLQQLQTQIETKLRNNSYTTEEQYNADVAQFQKKQQNAQSYLANLERNAALEVSQQQQQLMDSIASYIKIYNKDKHYDAILMKSAGFYFNPALDITDEIVENLNARYNKKK